MTTAMTTMTRALTIAAVVACLSPAPLGAQSATEAPYRASELVQRWNLIVTETFEDRKAFTSDEFIDEVGNLIDQFLSIGAVRAVKDHASEQQLKTADDGIKRLATAMVEAGERQSDGSTHVTEESFNAGRKKICPLYPFCQ